MKKEEAKKYIREKRRFVPYIQLFDIYSDDEDIPMNEIESLFLQEEKSYGRSNYIICSAPVAEQLNVILNKNK
jgi:hypothetical protein